MAREIRKMNSFDSSAEYWAIYPERLDQYYVGNDISEGEKIAVLLSVMGAKAYTLLHSLVAPAKPAKIKIVDNVTIHVIYRKGAKSTNRRKKVL